MASWEEFARHAPELATFGSARFQSGVAYLGTVRPDGSPRVHPVTPIIGDQLFLFMEHTSPKAADLQRDSRYMLHCSVGDSSGGGGESYVRGRATMTDDMSMRKKAIRESSHVPEARYILFILSIEFAFKNLYIDGKATPERWISG